MSLASGRKLLNVTEYYALVDQGILRADDRVELIAGEVREMSPIGSRHAACVSRLGAQFYRRLEGRAGVRIQGPVRLDEHSEPVPDVALLRPRDDFYAAAHPVPGDVLLLVEVADTTVRFDRKVKAPLYAAAGIPELWVIDIGAGKPRVSPGPRKPLGIVEVYRVPTAAGYGQVTRLHPGDQVTPLAFPDVAFEISELLP